VTPDLGVRTPVDGVLRARLCGTTFSQLRGGPAEIDHAAVVDRVAMFAKTGATCRSRLGDGSHGAESLCVKLMRIATVQRGARICRVDETPRLLDEDSRLVGQPL
jgi:hypothetical protein